MPQMGGMKGIELTELMELLKRGECTPEAMIKAAQGHTGKFPLPAYDFVKEALHLCQQDESGHVRAVNLLEAIRALALRKFGKGAMKALAEWKIFRTEDIGEIVFEMIEAGLFSKTPQDSKEDFANGFSFDEAFPES